MTQMFGNCGCRFSMADLKRSLKRTEPLTTDRAEMAAVSLPKRLLKKRQPRLSLISTDMASKPFSPKEIQRIIQCLSRPAVFLNMTDDWPGKNWSVNHLAHCLEEKPICFRIGKKVEEKGPLFETECSYVKATLAEFLCWTRGNNDSSVGPFTAYPLSEFWAYADYKYLALLLQDKSSMFKDLKWSDFGYPGRDGRESTLWIGTNGANTLCHLDTYGCNLVFQIQGRKRWHLFPPEDAECLYPTRIPYEESSVFSQVNVIRPDLYRFPAFQRARAHVVTLQPGQVLFVPRHWWHYVESVDPITVSVNSWMEMEVDDEARLEEALTKTIICALKTTPSLNNKDNWLNPTEEGISSHDENIRYLNLAVKACLDKRSTHAEKWSESAGQSSAVALKRDSTGRLKTTAIDTAPSYSVPFGPHLIPVTCDADERPKQTVTNLKGTNPHFSSQNSAKPEAIETEKQEEVVQIPGWPKTDGDTYGQISTNDLLDCLLHPDVITLVSQLMLHRQRELDSK
ncbi:HSPB1-associated protein 1 homolog [Hoplias malabaricus]|uniref:HSPB1-associated protein 1 homolog n=1 Tax=Hoplias malabaricus TaxID=27720 RepID=UPI003462C73D